MYSLFRYKYLKKNILTKNKFSIKKVMFICLTCITFEWVLIFKTKVLYSIIALIYGFQLKFYFSAVEDAVLPILIKLYTNEIFLDHMI